MDKQVFEILTQKNHAWISYQAEEWRKKSIYTAVKKEESFPFITISRQYGCAGFSLGELLVDALNKDQPDSIPWAVYDRKLLEQVENEYGIQQVLLASLTANTRDEISDFFSSFIAMRPGQSSIYHKMCTTIRALAHKGKIIVVGRGAIAATIGLDQGFHIRIFAPKEWRTAQVMKMHNLSSEKEARAILSKADREREAFVRKYFKTDLNDANLYHIMLNNSCYPREKMIDIIIQAYRHRFEEK